MSDLHQVYFQYVRDAPTDKSPRHYATQIRAHSSPSVATDFGNVLTALSLQPPISRKAFGYALLAAQEWRKVLSYIMSVSMFGTTRY